jgi:NAD+ diphosphatase
MWPQLATAVITLIKRDDKILLVNARNFRSDFYGLVAGFVETGETLEEAAKREIKEEVGLEVKNLKYFGSQPWPYPCGLMVGFTADYVSGEIKLQQSELNDAHWYSIDNLPQIPEKLSIARKLIDAWIEGRK